MITASSVNGVRHVLQASRSGDSTGFVLVGKETEMFSPAVEPGLSAPLLGLLRPVDSAIGRGTADLGGSILALDISVCRPEVDSSVVEFVPVDVVAFGWIAGLQSENLTVNRRSVTNAVQVELALRITIIAQPPSPLVDLVDIDGVNNGVGGDRSIIGVQREERGSVVLQDDRGVAILRAAPIPTHIRWLDREFFSTRLTDTLNRHRLLTPGGVLRPSIVTSNAGLSCVNYTSPYLVAA